MTNNYSGADKQTATCSQQEELVKATSLKKVAAISKAM